MTVRIVQFLAATLALTIGGACVATILVMTGAWLHQIGSECSR